MFYVYCGGVIVIISHGWMCLYQMCVCFIRFKYVFIVDLSMFQLDINNIKKQIDYNYNKNKQIDYNINRQVNYIKLNYLLSQEFILFNYQVFLINQYNQIKKIYFSMSIL